MQTINIHEAKTHLSRLLEEVSKGGEVVIAIHRNGRESALEQGVGDDHVDLAPGSAPVRACIHLVNHMHQMRTMGNGHRSVKTCSNFSLG